MKKFKEHTPQRGGHRHSRAPTGFAMTLLTRARVGLHRLDQQLDGVYAYNVLKSQRRVVLLSAALLVALMLLSSMIPPAYMDKDTLKGFTANTTFEGLYDFFDDKPSGGRASESGSEGKPKWVFINNKYPTPEVYQTMLEKHTPEQIVDMPLDQKCSEYFTELAKKNPEWMVHDLEHGYPYDRFIFDTKARFFIDRFKEFKKAMTEKNGWEEESAEDKAKEMANDLNKYVEWEISYERQRKASYDTESYMANSMTHLRVFSQCYLQDQILGEKLSQLEEGDNHTSCSFIEKRLFKFLTRQLPTYVRWNKEKLNQLPEIDKYLSDPTHTTASETYKSKCFVRELKEAYNGKGIAISAADKHMEDLLSLILVLRATQNRLPIQIIHRGDLSEASQSRLTNLARTMELNMGQIKSFQKYLQGYHADFSDADLDKILPPQEIWYVDITNAIDPDDRRFITYGNKMLTLLFASFEDTVLIDTDTVPFVNIDHFILESDKYKQNGAFFFKDRLLYDRMTGPELTYFHKLLPTRLDTAFFGVPELTNFTYNNRFFGEKYKHVQESGMVAINKNKHFGATLTINLLQMWHAATERVHGDKELFWLGFSIAGDESYYLNKYGVGAVGELNPNSNRLLGDADDSRRNELKSHMLCTTHPAHLSGLDDHTLLWMNSGFITCKRPNEAEKDIKMDLYKKVFENAEQLKETYVGPLKISAVIVPPPQERVINNDLGEPSSGWDVMFGCGGYLYCAFDRIGASEDPFYQGTLVEYDEREQLLYDYLGEIWVNYRTVEDKKGVYRL